MPTYTPTTWADEVPGETPVKYVITGANSDCTIELKTAPTAGTPVNASNLNNMETGIAAAILACVSAFKRQGDSGDYGENYGTNNYTVNGQDLLVQFGCSTKSDADQVTTFPSAFSAKPLVFMFQTGYLATNAYYVPVVSTVAADHFHWKVYKQTNGTTTLETTVLHYFNWIAIGPA